MSRSTSPPSAREKAAAVLRRQREQERRRRVLLLSGGAVLVAVLLLVVALAVNRNDAGPATVAASTPPAGLVEGAIVSGDPAAPVTVTLYEDFQCPACAQFERSVGPTLDELREAGAIRVEQRPLAFLDRASTDQYSSRSLNAVACVLDADPTAVSPFIASLFVEQPTEGGAGLSDRRLTELAADAGAAGVGGCVQDGTFRGWVAAMTASATSDGVNSTPTVLVNGQVLQDRTPQGLRAAVQAAAGTPAA